MLANIIPFGSMKHFCSSSPVLKSYDRSKGLSRILELRDRLRLGSYTDMTLSNAKASWNMQYIIGSIFTQLLGADNTAAIIGLISAVTVAVISSFFAISKELKIQRLEFENQKNLETVKFENEQKLKNLENELDLLSKYDIDLRNQRIFC